MVTRISWRRLLVEIKVYVTFRSVLVCILQITAVVGIYFLFLNDYIDVLYYTIVLDFTNNH